MKIIFVAAFGLLLQLPIANAGELVSIYDNPLNPSLAVSDNNMHSDSYVTDVSKASGPIGFSGKVSTFKYGKVAGEAAGILFDKKGDIVTVGVRFLKTELMLINRKTLAVKAAFELPGRPDVLLASATFQFHKMMDDTSGGSYFIIDEKNRAVIATADREILIVSQVEKNGSIKFKLEKRISLKETVEHTHCPSLRHLGFKDSRCDKVTTVIPDFQGNYWFITRYGKVGVVNRKTDAIKFFQLPNKEELQNSFAIGKDGTFIVSSHALYKFNYSETKGPFVEWRSEYDRGTARKLGQVNQGSGTSPSLMGDKYVAIADNADIQMNVLVYRRGILNPGEKRLVCSVPVFKPGQSASENSFIVFNNSIIVENNYGYKGPFARNVLAGGVVRVDVSADGHDCHVVWESDVISPTTVPKLSQGNGVIYLYTKDGNNKRKDESWSLTGLDFETGEIKTQIPTGLGNHYNNNWGAISLGPDGAAYIGSLKGFIKVASE